MSTIYYELFLREMLTNPEACDVYRQTMSALMANTWESWYVDVIMQNFQPTADPADILAWATVHAYIAAGHVWTCSIEIHSTPFSDSSVVENNAALRALPKTFEGEFFPEKGASASNDGFIRAIGEFTVDNAWSGQPLEHKTLHDTHYPLEVGYTKSYTTYRHLVNNGVVARWPYHSTSIYLLYLDREVLPSLNINFG